MLKEIDSATLNAINVFLARIKEYDFSEVILFGSCARGTQTPDSDIDLAIIFKFSRELSTSTSSNIQLIEAERFKLADSMAGIAFDVMSETGELINALPLFEQEWQILSTNSGHQWQFNNPELIENIKREGICIGSIRKKSLTNSECFL